MTCRAALESPIVEFSEATVPTVMGKVKNNFSIDHLLAKSDPVQSASDHHHQHVNRDIVSENMNFPNSSRYPMDTLDTYTEDYTDNASEDPSEDSFDNGTSNYVRSANP